MQWNGGIGKRCDKVVASCRASRQARKLSYLAFQRLRKAALLLDKLSYILLGSTVHFSEGVSQFDDVVHCWLGVEQVSVLQ